MQLYKLQKNLPAKIITPSSKSMFEVEIEQLLESDPILLTGEKILYIGRQVQTDTGKKLDLLAIDQHGRLIVIELKRDYAPREIIAQVLDYTSWLNKLSEREIEKIAKDYFEKNEIEFTTLHTTFEKTFNKPLSNAIGEDISIILFAKEFSQEVIRPAEYLNENGVPINCIKFDTFGGDGGIDYFLTQNIVGDEQVEEHDKEIEVPAITKKLYKKVIDKLTKYLEETYGDWSISQGAERTDPFKTYQDRPGTWTCSYINWLYKDETKFCVEFAIYPEDEDDPHGFCMYIHSRKQSESLTEFFDSGADILDLVKGYENESKSNKPSYAKYFDLEEITFESIKDLGVSEFEKIKPLIETILK